MARAFLYHRQRYQLLEQRKRRSCPALALDLLIVLRSVKIALVLMGAVVVLLSGRAWRRNKSGAMFFLALGFALITAGSVAAGVLFEFLGFELLEVSITEGVVQLLGFGIIIYSIYGRPT